MKKKILAIILALILVFACVLVIYTVSQKNKDVIDNKAETNQTDVTNEEKQDNKPQSNDESVKEETGTGAIMDAAEFEKKVEEVNDPSISKERKEELLAEIQAFLEQVDKNQQ